MKWILISAAILSCSFSFAAPAVSEVSLRQKALAESSIQGKSVQTATDAQVAGMLTLKDPRPEIITRRWNYFAGFSAQQFQPSGIAQKDGVGSFDLAKNGETTMPGFEFGALTPYYGMKQLNWKAGIRAKASIASQDTDVTLSSGFKINDARLNTSLISVGPLVQLQWARISWLAFTLSPQFGTLNYTQASANDYATFSKIAGYESMAYGLDFSVGKNWSLFTEWSQRQLKDTSEIALQKDNFELGTKITW
ncbi:hypothetical protein ACES2L_04035 [Bdellovibrio bacteriovorus]